MAVILELTHDPPPREQEAGTGPLSDLSVDKAAVEDNVLERISLLRKAFG